MSVLDLFAQLTRMATVVPLAVAAELAPAGEGRAAQGWLELRNTMRALERFWAAPALCHTGAGDGSPEVVERELVRRLAAADEGDPWDALWLREGLGFRWSEAAQDAGRPARATLPDGRWRLPLHTGMGLSGALRTLAPLALRGPSWTESAETPALEEAVERFQALCRAGSSAGCESAALEALGLVARVLHPGRVAALDRLLREADPALREGFWHGVGRGLYFTPAGSLPRMRPAAHALRRGRREAPDGAARRNAVAGVGWALALVNVRHPRVVAGALLDATGAADRVDPVDPLDPVGASDDADALADGIARAVVVWADAVVPAGEEAPDRTLEAFLEHGAESRSGGRDAREATGARSGELWRRRVVPRCRQALDEWLVDGRLRERFGGLFRASGPE